MRLLSYQSKSCFEEAILIASTILLIPFAARTTLQFSKIQCNWCSGDVVSANVPTMIDKTSVRRDTH